MSATENFKPLSKLPNFDPRRVPVLSVDSHLESIPASELQPEALFRRFKSPPVWEPELRIEPRFTQRPAVAASVLIPIVSHAEPTVLLTQRSHKLSNHSGQISFPGGKSEASDCSPYVTALRETHEEVGLDAHLFEVLGALPIYTTGSAFMITPVVALIQPGFKLAPNSDEVESVFEVPLAFLMDPSNHRRHSLSSEGVMRSWFSMPYQGLKNEHFIWGATAGILRNFYRFLSA